MVSQRPNIVVISKQFRNDQFSLSFRNSFPAANFCRRSENSFRRTSYCRRLVSFSQQPRVSKQCHNDHVFRNGSTTTIRFATVLQPGYYRRFENSFTLTKYCCRFEHGFTTTSLCRRFETVDCDHTFRNGFTTTSSYCLSLQNRFHNDQRSKSGVRDKLPVPLQSDMPSPLPQYVLPLFPEGSRSLKNSPGLHSARLSSHSPCPGDPPKSKASPCRMSSRRMWAFVGTGCAW